MLESLAQQVHVEVHIASGWNVRQPRYKQALWLSQQVHVEVQVVQTNIVVGTVQACPAPCQQEKYLPRSSQVLQLVEQKWPFLCLNNYVGQWSHSVIISLSAIECHLYAMSSGLLLLFIFSA